MEKRTEKHGFYTFEFDSELREPVKITNKEGKVFFVMGPALKSFLAELLRINATNRALSATDRELLGF